jgi:hypothetical protein
MTNPREVTTCLHANRANRTLNRMMRIRKFVMNANTPPIIPTLTMKPVTIRLSDPSCQTCKLNMGTWNFCSKNRFDDACLPFQISLPHSLRENLQKIPPIAGGTPFTGGDPRRGQIFKSPHTITSGLLCHGDTNYKKTGFSFRSAIMEISSCQYPGLLSRGGTKRA